MRVLIGCEESGVIREAFSALGHDAMSCDLLPTRIPGNHYQGNIMDLKDEPFDLAIFHPVCKYLTNAGVRWLHTDPQRWIAMFEGAAFFNALKHFNCRHIAIENPKPHRYAKALIGDYTQSVQPWMFGDLRSKETCWWLHGLPGLMPTNDVRAEMELLPKHEAHACHYAAPGPERERIRSESHPGMARAIAEQWGGYVLEQIQQLEQSA